MTSYEWKECRELISYSVPAPCQAPFADGCPIHDEQDRPEHASEVEYRFAQIAACLQPDARACAEDSADLARRMRVMACACSRIGADERTRVRRAYRDDTRRMKKLNCPAHVTSRKAHHLTVDILNLLNTERSTAGYTNHGLNTTPSTAGYTNHGLNTTPSTAGYTNTAPSSGGYTNECPTAALPTVGPANLNASDSLANNERRRALLTPLVWDVSRRCSATCRSDKPSDVAAADRRALLQTVYDHLRAPHRRHRRLMVSRDRLQHLLDPEMLAPAGAVSVRVNRTTPTGACSVNSVDGAGGESDTRCDCEQDTRCDWRNSTGCARKDADTHNTHYATCCNHGEGTRTDSEKNAMSGIGEGARRECEGARRYSEEGSRCGCKAVVDVHLSAPTVTRMKRALTHLDTQLRSVLTDQPYSRDQGTLDPWTRDTLDLQSLFTQPETPPIAAAASPVKTDVVRKQFLRSISSEPYRHVPLDECGTEPKRRLQTSLFRAMNLFTKPRQKSLFELHSDLLSSRLTAV